MKKICIITSTRADYGLLVPIIEKIKNDKNLKLQLIVTGMHLSPEFGLTYKQIEEDGYEITEKIEILLSSDTAVGISKSMGLTIISFSEAFERIKPDLIIALGDRYEIFSAVSTAHISKIPIAHLYGGETTQGAFDESLRHCISKMSYLHFTSTEEYKKRVIQLGENPNRVFNVGALGVENIKNMKLLSKEELEKQIDFELHDRYALVTFHPVTLEKSTSKIQFRNLLNALEEIQDLKVIFTKSNSDTDGRILNKMIDDFVMKNPKKYKAFVSMGQLRYLSAMKYSCMVIGNSSSGIVEAPSFKIPTINIGDRQKGRIQGETIINSYPCKEDILRSIQIATVNIENSSYKNVINPYGDGCTSEKIIKEIKKQLEIKINLKKKFYDIY